ncbi:MAG: phasin family protein [Burkholderiales bacterium]|nr:phasin family protein [Burkholderiales bacterium]
MSLNPEQISAAAQTQLATQLTVIHALSSTAIGGVEKLITLNFNTVKQTLENAGATLRQLLAAQGPQDLLALGNAQAQPQMESMLAYGRAFAAISSATGAQLLQAVNGASQRSAVKTGSAAAPAVKPAAKAVLKTEVPSPAKPTTKPAPQTLAKPVKAAVQVGNPQLPLLAQAEAKTIAAVAAVAVAVAKPAARRTAKKALAAKPVPPAVAAGEAKAAVALASVAPAAAKTDATLPADSGLAKPVPAAAPARPVAAERKSAVKFPFPPATKLQSGKPAFPNANAKPAYKAKGSAATGAKKPVRQ